MERWKWEMKEERYQRNQSFSSALLDAIYKSTDDDVSDAEELLLHRKKTTNTTTATTMKNKLNYGGYKPKQAAHVDKRATTIETKLAAEKLVLRRKAFELDNAGVHKIHTKAASSDSLSSELRVPLCLETQYTAILPGGNKYGHPPPVVIPPKKHSVADFCPTGKADEVSKSRGVHHLKFYKDFKKAKQPISPGSRIANFLNSLFSTTKKVKLSSSQPQTSIVFERQPHSPSTTSTTTTPSSRSCLSKTPSTRSNGVTRSVRFYVPGKEPEKVVSTPAMGERLTVRDLIDEYRQRKTTAAAILVDLLPESKSHGKDERDEEATDDDDDAESYSSSDLFELDHLSAVGLKELPVYETTSLATNHAIAKGLIL